MFGNIELASVLAILPEILLVILSILVIALDLVLKHDQRRNLGWIVAVGSWLIAILALVFSRPGEDAILYWGGTIRQDWLGFSFTLLFLFSLAATALLAMDIKRLGDRGEFYLMLLVSTLGMVVLAKATDLVLIYLALETIAIPLYILAGFFTRDEKSTESGFKYLLFGAMTSAIMLYGLSLLFGFSGTTNLYRLAIGLQAGNLPIVGLIGSLLLILIGFGFKISAVPLHFWTPDVYEGSPTPVAGFLSTASKAAGFAILIRFLIIAFPAIQIEWGAVLAAMSVATMTLGNLLALTQKNIKRMLAFSSIAHAGYAMIGLVAGTTLGISSTVFYLVAYILTNLAAFGVVAIVGRTVGSDEISAYDGLSRRSPWLALAMMVAFLSLAGMPPLAGFVGKLFVFAAAVQAGLIWLAVIGVLNSIIGLYYYLVVLKHVYLYRSEDEEAPLPVTRPNALMIGVLVFGIVLVGTLVAPWFNWATQAAQAMF